MVPSSVALPAHVNHGLPGGDQSLGEQVAEAARALDGPGALGPGAGPALEPPQGGLVGRHSQLADHTSGFVQSHGRVRRLVRIDPDGDHVSLLLKGCRTMGSAAADNLSCRKHFTPLSSDAGGGR
jgi:hypothetical protein